MTSVDVQIKVLPSTPGVYLFYNSSKELIYVGKATNLKSRVSSYFRKPRSPRPIEQMIHEVVKIKVEQTDSALEAIILEGNYIKKFRPRHNVDWRDDKSWNYIVITKDDYPRIETLREHELNQLGQGASKKFKYIFGPYPGLNTKAAFKLLRRLFRYSTCHPHQKKPCLYYQMHQCLGVCVGEISAKDYGQKVIMPMVMLLRGKKKTLLKQLNTKMTQASANENYEEASRLCDQIKALQRIQDIALLNKTFIHNQVAPSQSVRIEGYDISNLGTQDKVGSMVVFNEIGPVKSQYRKFNIKTVVGQSDVDCLREVIERRIKREDWPAPDVYLIDGGAPQVNVVLKILRDHDIVTPVVGIAKGPTRKRNTFLVRTEPKSPLISWIASHAQLLIAVRDEAHRFAITFNRTKRKIL